MRRKGRWHRASWAGTGMSTRIAINPRPEGMHNFDPDVGRQAVEIQDRFQGRLQETGCYFQEVEMKKILLAAALLLAAYSLLAPLPASAQAPAADQAVHLGRRHSRR